MNRPYSIEELERLARRILAPLDGQSAAVVQAVLIAGLLHAMRQLEEDHPEIPFPAHLVVLRNVLEQIQEPLVAALGKGPFDGLPFSRTNAPAGLVDLRWMRR